ncbi:alpha-(1,6)-fucosyltransferase-like [Hydractinia symbiolongicarpus]|uniref:alpha-(1,6)-fucosyltransferase-like n=1 Tax=Hydractinia symbiolongicarpus TaxID=13093 RepID=UPI00254A91E0|nr:alpha-(1,6)-fucosyltransferase-like [Hydractinia symbiolongicarpus]
MRKLVAVFTLVVLCMVLWRWELYKSFYGSVNNNTVNVISMNDTKKSSGRKNNKNSKDSRKFKNENRRVKSNLSSSDTKRKKNNKQKYQSAKRKSKKEPRKNVTGSRNHPLRNMSTFTSLEDVHNEIKNQLVFLQEEGDCEKKKILHCEIINNFAGLGSMMHRYGACIQVAYGLGRMFFIEQNTYKNIGGLSQWLLSESTRCGYIKEKYHRTLRNPKEYYKNVCRTNDKNCYLENGYDLNNTYKIIIFYPQAEFPTPRHIPGTIPMRLEKTLQRLHVADPRLWFSAQMLSFFLTPNKKFRKKLNIIRSEIKFRHPIVGMHIRHAPHKMTEANYYEESSYTRYAELFFKERNYTKKHRNVYIATDVLKSINRVKKLLPANHVITMPILMRKKSLRLYRVKKQPKEVIEAMFIDLFFLAHSDYIVCTLSSNVCRLVYLMKLAKSPYTVENKLKSLDVEMFYDYTGFRYAKGNGIQPTTEYKFHNYTPIAGRTLCVAVRANKGNAGLVQYTAGDVFVSEDWESNNDLMFVKQIYKYDKKGYVKFKDFIRWPGEPSYHFYR